MKRKQIKWVELLVKYRRVSMGSCIAWEIVSFYLCGQWWKVFFIFVSLIFFLFFGRYYFSVSIWKLTDDYFGKVEASITPLKGKFKFCECYSKKKNSVVDVLQLKGLFFCGFYPNQVDELKWKFSLDFDFEYSVTASGVACNRSRESAAYLWHRTWHFGKGFFPVFSNQTQQTVRNRTLPSSP